MTNHPYPKPRIPAFSANLAVCDYCQQRWMFAHPATGFEFIHRICPNCIPRLTKGRAA